MNATVDQRQNKLDIRHDRIPIVFNTESDPEREAI